MTVLIQQKFWSIVSLWIYLFLHKDNTEKMLSSKPSWVCDWAPRSSVMAEEVFQICILVYLLSVVINTLAAKIMLIIGSLENWSFQRNTLHCFWWSLGYVAAIVSLCLLIKKSRAIWAAQKCILYVIPPDLSAVTHQPETLLSSMICRLISLLILASHTQLLCFN